MMCTLICTISLPLRRITFGHCPAIPYEQKAERTHDKKTEIKRDNHVTVGVVGEDWGLASNEMCCWRCPKL